jgi:hypothetical protein
LLCVFLLCKQHCDTLCVLHMWENPKIGSA